MAQSVELFRAEYANGDPFEVAREIRGKCEAVMRRALVIIVLIAVAFTGGWVLLPLDSVAPGDEIVVHAGSYAGARIESSGTVGAYIALKAAEGESVIHPTR